MRDEGFHPSSLIPHRLFMDRRITIGVVVVLLLLSGYVWYTFLRADAPPTTPTGTPAPTAILFSQVDQSKVQAIEVKDLKNNVVTQLTRSGDTWTMNQPKQGGSDTDRIDQLLLQLAHTTATRKLDAPGDLTQFGLNPPLYQAKLTYQDGSALTINLGTKNTDSSAFYAVKDGDTAVYLIEAAVGTGIQQFVTTPPYTPTPTETPAATEPPAETETPASAPVATPTP